MNNENNNGNNANRNNESAFEQALLNLHAELSTAMYDEQLERDGSYRRTTGIYGLLSMAEVSGPLAITIASARLAAKHMDDYKTMTDLLMALKYKERYYTAAQNDDDSPIFKALATEYSVACECVHDDIITKYSDNAEAMDYISEALYA